MTDLVQLLILTASGLSCLPASRWHMINVALDYHTKRAAYQAGCIWSQATTRQMEVLSPTECEWKQQTIIWTSLPPITEGCQQLTKYGCKIPAEVDANAIGLACHVLNCAAVTVKVIAKMWLAEYCVDSIIYMPNEHASDKCVLF